MEEKIRISGSWSKQKARFGVRQTPRSRAKRRGLVGLHPHHMYLIEDNSAVFPLGVQVAKGTATSNS